MKEVVYGREVFIEYGHHKYGHARSGRPQTCLRCRVQRRSAKDRNGRQRRDASGKTGGGRWQYRPPCSLSWQFKNLPCSVRKEAS